MRRNVVISCPQMMVQCELLQSELLQCELHCSTVSGGEGVDDFDWMRSAVKASVTLYRIAIGAE